MFEADTEAQCREALAKALWPERFRCPDCGHTGHCHLAQRDVPLRTWFLAILMTQHKNGISALALRRELGVSYNTA